MAGRHRLGGAEAGAAKDGWAEVGLIGDASDEVKSELAWTVIGMHALGRRARACGSAVEADEPGGPGRFLCPKLRSHPAPNYPPV